MIKLNYKFRGYYKLESAKVFTDDYGNVVEIPGSRKTLAEFENIITDLGENEIGTRPITSCFTSFYVGSGNTPASVLDSDMDVLVASTSTHQSNNVDTQTVSQPYYIYQQLTRRFAQGTAEGNLAEVGVGWNINPSGALFSRALIQDSMGNPTTIQVQSDEVLDVTYEFRIYMNTTDVVGTVNIGGVTYDYIARPSEIDLINVTVGWSFSFSAVDARFSKAYSGAIGDVFSSPSGTSSSGSNTDGTYSNGSLQATTMHEFSLTQGNIGGIRSIAFGSGWGAWQVEFSAQGTGDPIPKDGTNVLSWQMTHSWARGSI